MLNERNLIHTFLSNLGLDDEESLIYLKLIEYGSLSYLELSRSTSINRTTLYRLIEKLKNKGIVEEIIDEHRRLIKAVDIHKIEFLIKEQESKAKILRDLFPNISSILPQTSFNNPQTKVLFYKGKDGIKQMFWNTLRAKDECVGFTYRSAKELVGEEFKERWSKEFIKRGLFFRDIYSDSFLESIGSDIESNIFLSPKSFFKSKYISSNILNINHQVDIYNNVVAFYNWFNDEIFGVEIYNKEVSTMQKQLFEIVWKISEESHSV